MNEQVKKAFDFASDSTKQLITLSTAILTLTITFGKDVLQKVEGTTKENLTYCWVIYLVSIFFGILTLLALTGTLDPKKKKQQQSGTLGKNADIKAHEEKLTGAVPIDTEEGGSLPTIQASNIRIFSVLQILTFLAATGLVVKSGIAMLSIPSTSTDTTAKVEQVVRDKQRTLIEALLRRDSAAIDQNLTEDCVIMASRGQVMNRNQVTSALNSAELTYETINVDDVSVRMFGNTAVGVGHAVVKGKYKEQAFDGQFRFSAVFAKSQDIWQVVSIQVARVDQVTGSATNVGGRTKRSRGRRSSRRNRRARTQRLSSLTNMRELLCCTMRRSYLNQSCVNKPEL
jgi:ketosteroid isomerase-like protein